MCKLNKKNKGFTLIELMVSISVFVIIMLICAGSIFSVLDSNRKSQTLRSVMDNLNVAMESMTRNIRFGSNYHCGSGGVFSLPQECWAGDNNMVVTSSDGSLVRYRLLGSSIKRSIDTGAGFATEEDITAPDIVIQNLIFKIRGADKYPDTYQPRVMIIVSGYVGTKPSVRSSFSLQTTISQRLLDYNP